MQSVQDFFADTMGITLLTVREGKWLTDPSNPFEFCRKYPRLNLDLYDRCKKCHGHWEQVAIKQKKPILFECEMGLANFIFPVIIENTYMSSLLGGQVLFEKPDCEKFKKIALKLGFKEDEFLSEVQKLNIVSKEKLQGMADLLFWTLNAFSTVAYENKKLAELGINYTLKQNIELKNWLVSNYENMTTKSILTNREKEILKLVVKGKSNTQIAKELFISVHTVKAHVSTILEKLGVEDRVQVAVKAVKEGMVD